MRNWITARVGTARETVDAPPPNAIRTVQADYEGWRLTVTASSHGMMVSVSSPLGGEFYHEQKGPLPLGKRYTVRVFPEMSVVECVTHADDLDGPMMVFHQQLNMITAVEDTVDPVEEARTKVIYDTILELLAKSADPGSIMGDVAEAHGYYLMERECVYED
jgi:hypothetical protein